MGRYGSVAVICLSIILLLLFQTLGRTQVDGASGVPQPAYTDAMTAYNAGDFDSAHTMFFHLAQQGNVDAKAMLGVLYFHGHGVEADRVKSAIWFYQAALAGRASAQLVIGKLYLTGDGVSADRGEAAFWLTLARERGDKDVAANADAALSQVLPTLDQEMRRAIERRATFWRPVISDQDATGR